MRKKLSFIDSVRFKTLTSNIQYKQENEMLPIFCKNRDSFSPILMMQLIKIILNINKKFKNTKLLMYEFFLIKRKQALEILIYIILSQIKYLFIHKKQQALNLQIISFFIFIDIRNGTF